MDRNQLTASITRALIAGMTSDDGVFCVHTRMLIDGRERAFKIWMRLP